MTSYFFFWLGVSFKGQYFIIICLNIKECLQLDTIYHGDALQVLKTFDNESIDCICTSPPYYGLRDYGIEGQLGREKRPQEYISNLMAIMNECKRVLKKTGSLWVNIGDSYASQGGLSKPEHLAKANVGSTKAGVQRGIRHSTHIKNLGVGEKSLIGIPERFVIAMTDSGWIRRNSIIWYKPNCMPSSAKDRFTVDFEYFYFFTKSPKYYFETQHEPISQATIRRYKNGNIPTDDTKYNKIKPDTAVGNLRNGSNPVHINGRIKRCVWSINTTPFPKAHFATFPQKLIETPIKACCPDEICNKCNKPRVKTYVQNGYIHVENRHEETNIKWGKNSQLKLSPTSTFKTGKIKRFEENGLSDCGCNAGFHSGIVLDPFSGAGTTAVVAKKLGRNFVGIELNEEYISISEKRITNSQIGG